MSAHLLRRLRLAHLLLLALSCAGAILAAPPPAGAAQEGGEPLVLVAPIEGAIDPVAVEFLGRALEEAREENAAALVLRIDTPGGLSTSMDEMVKRIVNAEDMPVIAWVAPSGARAGSAGAFITMASDVAAMAPGTTIGSATPVSGGGQDIGEDLRKKVVNDAASKMRALASERGRNADLAEDFVREAENVTAEEALEQNVIEYVEGDLDELLERIDGNRLEPKGLQPDLDDANVRELELPVTLRLLKVLIDPNLLFLLFAGGLLGLAFELTHPGSIIPGVAGVIMLLLALYGLQVLPTTGAGIAFLLVAVALFATEALVASHGVLGAGGAVALFLGGLLLFENQSGYSIDIWLLVLVSGALLALLTFVVRKALAARREPPRTGAEFLIGAVAQVRRALEPEGIVYVEGELWKAVLESGGHAAAGSRVVVDRVEGMVLYVSRAPGDAPPPLADDPAQE